MLALLVALGATPVRGQRDATPAAAPEFEAAYLGRAGRLRLSELKGQVVLVNFWASWCAPCRYEMPHFQTLFERFGGEGFEVVAINTMDQREKALAFLAEHRFSFSVLFDEGDRIAGDFSIKGPPQTFLVGRDGRFIAIPDPKTGETKLSVYDPTVWAHPKTAAFLKELLVRK